MPPVKMHKCPRCNLPQEGIHRCQYCGFDLSKYKKKDTKTIRNRLKGIIAVLNKEPFVKSNKKSTLQDNGGTRSGTDRRVYVFMKYFPEKRSGRDRRKRVDRRRKAAKKEWSERRFSLIQGSPTPHRT